MTGPASGTQTSDAVAPPPKWLWAAEFPRALWGLVSLGFARRRLTDGVPRGDGRPVIVFPGLANPDRRYRVICRYLNALGYDARGWGLGFNLGRRTIGRGSERLDALIRDSYARAGQPLTLIGVSLGGILARLAAHRHPDLVRQVITVSAPYAGDPRATNVWRVFEWLTGEKVDDPAVARLREEIAAPLPMPATAIWSATDGLVSGELCHGGDCADIEVRANHVGVQNRPEVLRAIARILGGAR